MQTSVAHRWHPFMDSLHSLVVVKMYDKCTPNFFCYFMSLKIPNWNWPSTFCPWHRITYTTRLFAWMVYGYNLIMSLGAVVISYSKDFYLLYVIFLSVTNIIFILMTIQSMMGLFHVFNMKSDKLSFLALSKMRLDMWRMLCTSEIYPQFEVLQVTIYIYLYIWTI